MTNCDTSQSFQITLASASPRRRELLDQIQVSYEVLPVDIDESLLPGESGLSYVTRLAKQKAEAGYKLNTKRPVLGSDTTVVFKDKIMGKPENKEDAIEILSSLSANTHEVITAVAICGDGFLHSDVSVSQVEFAELSLQQIESYWQTGEPADKAGAYGIQGIAAQFIKKISGSYSGIMGLPLYETAQLLNRAGISLMS